MATETEKELWQLTASEVLPRLRKGELKAEDYVQSLVRRIQGRDQDVKAWVYFSPIHALQQAQLLDNIPLAQRGPLHGLPVAIKDIALTKDMPTQYNSPLFETSLPIGTDANCVASLRAAGAIIIGKTSTTEFATSKQGNWHQNITANVHDPKRTPGGSSSGSGAAVADFQVPLALGTQTGGSIIRPASFNGCYGLKPTFGAISREGIARWCETLDTAGFFTRSVEDLEILMDVFQIHDDVAVPKEPFKVEGAKIGFCRTNYWPNAGPGTVHAMLRAKAHGAQVEDIDLPDGFSNVLDWHAALLAAEGQTSFLGQYLTDKDRIHEKNIVDYVETRKGVSRSRQLQAYDNCAKLRPVFDEIARKYDAVLTPSVVDQAPVGIESTGDMNFCSTWTIMHVPALNIPGFAGDDGMPIGLTAVGPRFTDRRLLHVAKSLGYVFEKEGGCLSKPEGGQRTIGVRRTSTGYRSRPSIRT